MSTFIHQAGLFFKRNASTILTIAGGAGAIVTTVTAVYATPKAMRKIEKVKAEKGEDLTKLETVVVAAPIYIPSIVIGAGSLACIFGANHLNKRQQASLMSAYALVSGSYKEYKKKVEEMYGADAHERVIDEIAKDKYEEENIEVDEDPEVELFYDEFTRQYFNSTKYKVQRAEYEINREIQMRGWATLAEYCELLDLDYGDEGESLGWSEGGNLARYWQSWVDFTHRKVELEDGMECYIVTMFQEPYLEFEDDC